MDRRRLIRILALAAAVSTTTAKADDTAEGKLALVDVVVGPNRDVYVVREGLVERQGSEKRVLAIERFDSTGSRVRGPRGEIRFFVDWPLDDPVSCVALIPPNAGLVFAADMPGLKQVFLLSVKPDGNPHEMFGSKGAHKHYEFFSAPGVKKTDLTEFETQAIAADSGHRVVLATAIYPKHEESDLQKPPPIRLWRTSGGATDETFGKNGIATLAGPENSHNTRVHAIIVDGSNRILVSGVRQTLSHPPPNILFVSRISENGATDRRFGSIGTVQFSRTSFESPVRDVRVSYDGKSLAYLSGDSTVAIKSVRSTHQTLREETANKLERFRRSARTVGRFVDGQEDPGFSVAEEEARVRTLQMPFKSAQSGHLTVVPDPEMYVNKYVDTPEGSFLVWGESTDDPSLEMFRFTSGFQLLGAGKLALSKVGGVLPCQQLRMESPQ